MKKYRINDILGDNNGLQQNGVDRQSGQGLPSGQRFQLNQSLQNRIQRRYEADGSEEEEMQRQNQLLAISQSMPPFGPSVQRNVNSGLGSGEEYSGASNVSNLSNIDANSLYHKLKELQEAEQRLKQVEDLMRSIEKMENNIKEVKTDGQSALNPGRKASNELQTKFVSRHNVAKPSARSASSVSTQPKQLTHSANNTSITNPQKNIIPRNIDENNLELNVNTNGNASQSQSQHLLSQTMDFCDNNLGYSTDLDESEGSNSEESFNLINGNLIRSMRSQFDSMRSQFETMFPVLENQFTNGNTNININNNQNIQNTSNNSNSFATNQQFFHLMLLQNYQILQQQQMLLLWLQQQNQCQTPHLPHPHSHPLPQPIQEQPQRRQSHSSHHYLNERQTNISAMPQNSIHYRNSTLNSMRNNEVNAHNMTALNNQVVPGVRANNYWDNFKSFSRQNKLSASANCKTYENLSAPQHQMMSPVLVADQQVIHNTNQCLDANCLSPNSTLRSHSYKAANASHGQCTEHMEKQQNLPQFNDSIQSKATHSQQSQHSSDSNNFAALFSMLEKLIESDDKYSTKSAAKKKSTNLVITSDNEEELGGAVGGVGVGVTNVVNNQISFEDSNENSNKCSQQSTASVRSQATGANIAIPLHIPASSGAIRKKPRNHEILEFSIKSENNENFGLSSVNGSELIRPLMAAEGRSSETGIANTALQKTSILAVRPPTTGAPPYDCDSPSNASSDDELAEADQTASELIGSESESNHNNNTNSNNNCILNNNCLNTNPNPNPNQTNSVTAQALDTSLRSGNEDNIVVNNDNVEEEEEEEEDDDNILANDSNEGAIRLSGDGEQGL